MKRHNYKKLQIWSEGIELITKTYRMTSSFPDNEKFGLISQLNRCSISISSNIAEGSSKSSNKHFAHFLETSLGSAFEWETQLIVSFNLGYINEKEFSILELRINRLQKKISKFMDKIKF